MAVLASVAVLLPATVVRGERLPSRLFTRTDGLATDRVARIVRDSHGFLWFATGGGLSRFDGRDFRTFGPSEGLTLPYVNDILEERPGRYWVATNGGGLFLFTPLSGGAAAGASRFVRVAVGPTAASNRVNVLSRDGSGRLWIGTDDGLFLMESTGGPDATRRIESRDGRLGEALVQVWSLLPQRDGTVWAGTSMGLFALLPGGEMLHHPIRPLQGADHVFALLVQEDGELLVGHDSGLFRARLRRAGEQAAIEVLRPWEPPRGVPPRSVRAFHRMRDGSVWFTGSGGLGTIEDGRPRTVIGSTELESEVRALAEDATGSIWVARTAGGVVRIVRAGLVEYDGRDGLGESPFGAIFESTSGELCVFGRRDISVLGGRTFTRVTPVLPSDVLGVGRAYGSALEDSQGEWWIPAGDRLYRFPRVATVRALAVTPPRAVYTTRDGLAGVDISKIFEDSRGDIWLNSRIPGRDVVTRWDRRSGRFFRYGDADGLPANNAVYAFGEDRAGHVWLSFLEGGLARYRQGAFEWVPGSEGVGTSAFGALHVDKRGRLWVGTLRDVRRIDDTLAESPADLRVATVQGLEATRVSTFVEDRRGHLYLSTDDGLIRWDMDEDRPHRLPVPGGGSGLWTVSFRDRHGVLWFGGNRGVTGYTPPETITPAPVSLRIGSVRVNGRALPIDDLGQADVPRLALTPGERRIEIGFFALGASREDDVRFQYRLDSGPSDWSAPSPAGSVDFAHLASGAYRFEVRPVNAAGAPLGAPATVSFDIPPPVWARRWFLALGAVALAGAGVLIHRRRVARAVELERIRTSIASDLHDDIGANLSQISLLSEMLHGKGVDADPDDATTLASISELSRESLDSMSDIVWAIDPHKDHLSSLSSRMRRFASDVLGARDIPFEMRVDGTDAIEIGADTRRHIYLAFKEALNNVVRHSGAGHVAIHLQRAGTDLVLLVSDDGRGFDTAGHSDGHGLRSLRERARKAGGVLDVRSAPGRGTAVTLRVPVGRTHLIM